MMDSKNMNGNRKVVFELIRASEARRMTQESKELGMIKEKRILDEMIRDFAMSGSYSIFWDASHIPDMVLNELIDELQAAKYSVESNLHLHASEKEFIVCWEEKREKKSK